MRDHISEDLLSAYIDGELAEEERELVERMLAESPADRALCLELQSLRDTFQGLPKYQLSADFHRRVIAEIERFADADSPGLLKRPEHLGELQPAMGRPAVASSRRSTARWLPLGLAVAAAAAITMVVVLTPRPDNPDVVVENSAPQTSQPAQPLFVPEESWYGEQYVYYLRPSQQEPTLTMVVDLVITPEGQASFAFQNAFRRAGVPFDDDMEIDAALEESLLSSRIAGNVRLVGQGDEHDTVALYYVVCESDKANDILNYFRGRPHEVMAQLGLAYNSRELEMLYLLNRSSVAQFADAKSGKEKRSLAHRLVFSVRLRSATLPAFLAAATGSPAEAEANPERRPGARTPHVARLETAPTELLFVVRNLKEPTEP